MIMKVGAVGPHWLSDYLFTNITTSSFKYIAITSAASVDARQPPNAFVAVTISHCRVTGFQRIGHPRIRVKRLIGRRVMLYNVLGTLTTSLLILNARPTSSAPISQPNNNSTGLHLHILHTNDKHSSHSSNHRFEQTSASSQTCSDSDAVKNKCYGGFARLATVIRNARASNTSVLYLDAGDTYQGSNWFVVHRWNIVSKFQNILRPDAMSLGNHEFDHGVNGLLPFLRNASYPILAANLNLTNEPELQATKLAKSTILDVNGTRVGIIGYLTPTTKNIAKTGNVIFEDEIEAVSKEARRLKNNGVNILIGLGHSGYQMDKRIAAEVEDIDLVIGGHTNTFLNNGTQPDSEVSEGLYPTPVIQSSGRTVYVVQAYAYTKYVGNLSLTFDSEGELTRIEGNPILLDSRIEQARDVLEELENWRQLVDNLGINYVGSSRVLLNGDRKTCRRQECNIGNLITDALVDYNMRQYRGAHGWTDAAIAVLNTGVIRSSIPAKSQITEADVLSVLPYRNVPITVLMTGEVLRSMLEWSVSSVTNDLNQDDSGAFLQFSGLQVTYDFGKVPNSKVVSVRVRCANCSFPEFRDLDEREMYPVIISDYLYGGGDGFSMLRNLKSKPIANGTFVDAFIGYLKAHSPIHTQVDCRITVINTDSPRSVGTPTATS
ncbi:protein 5NUC-like isoform X1 [Neodiprion virginianus]|uniref:protein 5NUC-like isoform X1 n=2 Tax=Neodiprion virginianus TaxID=2961670 RepID=UPI001EE6C47F|nr:protein 5NUC-like isoform X1 [Neodiprion virginianus]